MIEFIISFVLAIAAYYISTLVLINMEGCILSDNGANFEYILMSCYVFFIVSILFNMIVHLDFTIGNYIDLYTFISTVIYGINLRVTIEVWLSSKNDYFNLKENKTLKVNVRPGLFLAICYSLSALILQSLMFYI